MKEKVIQINCGWTYGNVDGGIDGLTELWYSHVARSYLESHFAAQLRTNVLIIQWRHYWNRAIIRLDSKWRKEPVARPRQSVIHPTVISVLFVIIFGLLNTMKYVNKNGVLNDIIWLIVTFWS